MLFTKVLAVALSAVAVFTPAIAAGWETAGGTIVMPGKTDEGATLVMDAESDPLYDRDGKVSFNYGVILANGDRRRATAFTDFCLAGKVNRSLRVKGFSAPGWKALDFSPELGDFDLKVVATSKPAKELLRLVCQSAQWSKEAGRVRPYWNGQGRYQQ